MKKNFLILVTGILLTGCSFVSNKERDVYNFNYAGTMAPLEMSTWQYGTHTFTTEGGDFYAVKSEIINLDDFIGEPIHVLGDEVDGYPVDNGPKFIDIKKIQVTEK